MDITSPKVITQLLEEYSLAPLKKFCQNFLCDKNIIQKIAAAAVPEQGLVLEIGPGLGALTQALARRAGKVVAIEIDEGMVKVLGETLKEYDNVTVLNDDILKTNLHTISRNYFNDEKFYVVGNLPYYITSKCILSVLESGLPIQNVTVMVQKEVAQRLAARPGDSNYGALTASVNYFGGAQSLFDVSRTCFLPKPDVDSAVIQIHMEKALPVDREAYVRTVRGLFAMRRKTVLNNLQSSLSIPKERANEILLETGIPANKRAQDLTPDQFMEIAKKICEKNN